MRPVTTLTSLVSWNAVVLSCIALHSTEAFVPPTRPHPAAAVSTRRFSTVSAATPAASAAAPAVKYQCDVPPFNNVLAANRAEIAVRIMRAATELNIATTALFVEEDKFSQHRWGADKSYQLSKQEGATPISAYLDIPQIIALAKNAQVDAIHPVRRGVCRRCWSRWISGCSSTHDSFT